MRGRIIYIFNLLALSILLSGCVKNIGKQPEEELISEEEAKEIALKDAGVNKEDLSYILINLETDNGVDEYEVEFYSDKMEYEYNIDASTGEILNRDINTNS